MARTSKLKYAIYPKQTIHGHEKVERSWILVLNPDSLQAGYHPKFNSQPMLGKQNLTGLHCNASVNSSRAHACVKYPGVTPGL